MSSASPLPENASIHATREASVRFDAMLNLAE
jgi:hypothetical protein